MINYFSKVCLVIALLAVVMLSTSCSASKKTTVMRVNDMQAYSNAQMQLIRELGLLEKHVPEGVTVEWSTIPYSSEVRDAIVSNNLDISGLAITNTIAAIENDLPIVVLSNSSHSVVSLFSKREDIKSVSDFTTSDKISISGKGSSPHMAFMVKCKEELGNPAALENTLTIMNNSDAVALLQSSNDLDGALVSFPSWLALSGVEGINLVSDLSDVIKEYGISNLMVAREEFFDNNPELIEAFLNAQKEVVAFVNENPEEAAEILAGLYEIDSAPFLEVIKNFPLTNAISASAYNNHVQIIYEAGILENRPRPLSEIKNYENLEVVD